MAVGTERTNLEVSLGVPVHRIWSAGKKIETVMPLVLPDAFSSCDSDGDGGPGTIRVYHCGPAIQEGQNIRERIDEIDEGIHSISYTVLGGDPRYRSMRASITYLPSVDGASSRRFSLLFRRRAFQTRSSELISLMQTTMCEYLLSNPAYE